MCNVKDGKGTITEAKCISPVRCPAPEQGDVVDFTKAFYENCDDLIAADTCKYRCPENFIQGSEVLNCNERGQLEEPQCTQIVCDPKKTKDVRFEKSCLGLAVGEKCEFTCLERGAEPEGPVTCTNQDGKGVFTEAKCIPPVKCSTKLCDSSIITLDPPCKDLIAGDTCPYSCPATHIQPSGPLICKDNGKLDHPKCSPVVCEIPETDGVTYDEDCEGLTGTFLIYRF